MKNNLSINIVDKIRLFFGVMFLTLSILMFWSNDTLIYFYRKIRNIPSKKEVSEKLNSSLSNTLDNVVKWYKEE